MSDITQITDEALAELERLAKAAWPMTQLPFETPIETRLRDTCDPPTILALCARVRAAEAVVEKLDKTEDGVPVVSGVDVIWQIDPDGFINSPPDMAGPDPTPRPWSSEYGGFQHVRSLPCYSTAAAAIRAREGGTGE